MGEKSTRANCRHTSSHTSLSHIPWHPNLRYLESRNLLVHMVDKAASQYTTPKMMQMIITGVENFL